MSAYSLHDTVKDKREPILNSDEIPQSSFLVHDQFLLFGDSITQSDGDPSLGFSCYQALQHGMSTSHDLMHLADHADYCRRVDIVKRGFSGYNTANALSILPKILLSPEQSRVRFLVRDLRNHDCKRLAES